MNFAGGQGWWWHDHVNEPNTTVLHITKWFQWCSLCHTYSSTIFFKESPLGHFQTNLTWARRQAQVVLGAGDGGEFQPQAFPRPLKPFPGGYIKGVPFPLSHLGPWIAARDGEGEGEAISPLRENEWMDEQIVRDNRPILTSLRPTFLLIVTTFHPKDQDLTLVGKQWSSKSYIF